jgi:hypothetical protein
MAARLFLFAWLPAGLLYACCTSPLVSSHWADGGGAGKGANADGAAGDSAGVALF